MIRRVPYDIGGGHGVIFPMAGPVQCYWGDGGHDIHYLIVGGVHLPDKAGQAILGTVRHRSQAHIVLHSRPGYLRIVHLGNQNGFGYPEGLKLGDVSQQLDHGPLSGLGNLTGFRFRYPVYRRQDGVPSGAQICLKFLNLAAVRHSVYSSKSLKRLVSVSFLVQNIRVLPGLQPLLRVQVRLQPAYRISDQHGSQDR